MPQMQLPIFPVGATHLSGELAFKKQDGVITYFNGQMPVFAHAESDTASFRMITSQFYCNGVLKQSAIVKIYGVSAISVKRWVKRYKEGGPQTFYREPKRGGPRVMTCETLARAQQLLNDGLEAIEVAGQMGLKANTLRKALREGRLQKCYTASGSCEVKEEERATTKSERNATDQAAQMGIGATNTMDRVAASLGQMNGVAAKFTAATDVPNAGVLLALPVLLAMGLLRNVKEHFQLPKGYYSLPSIFLLLAFLALARKKSYEGLRYCAPGEWGKLLGLDRIPEVRTLRGKVGNLCESGEPRLWSAALCADWMGADAEQAQVLYVDGHVRVYHGNQTKLPKHYVARQKLCLRATTDYWVNAMDGQPFFVINQAVDPGLIKVLENEIVPRLKKEVPQQPTEEQLGADPLLHRFTMIFDREGYSPQFLLKMKEEHRIACLTYNKYPGEAWGEEEFTTREVKLKSGNVVKMRLAERKVLLGGKVWVREIRKLTESGHQTSIVATDYRSDLGPASAAMFARWSQENFFRYMREHYNLDRIIEYGTEGIGETVLVVNPRYRQLEGEIRKRTSIKNRASAQFGALTLEGDIAPQKVAAYQEKKAALQEEIERLNIELAELKEKRKGVARRITVGEMPKEEKFAQLRTKSKHFIDTIKLIAYRAETAMAHTLREKMSRNDDAHTLLQAIYTTEADLLPNETAGTLTVRLHHLANRATDMAIRHLCDELNSTATFFPGTKLRLIYELVS